MQSKGLYLALLTALISGISIFINKFAVASFASPVLLPTLKNGLVGIAMLTLVLTSHRWRTNRAELKALTLKQQSQLVALALIGGALPFYLFFTGLAQTPAVNAAIIHKSLVVWVAVLAVPFLKEKLTKTLGLAVLLLFASNLLPGGFKGLTLSTGELLIFMATLLWALETIVAKKLLATVSADVAATARMGLGSLMLLLVMLVTAPMDVIKLASLSPTQWLWVGLTSVTLLAYVSTWYRALQLAPAITVSAILVSATLITNLLAAIFITHTWTVPLTLQGIAIGTGSLLVLVAARRLPQPIMVK
jgi:drug/metabolite transporter (DMT)-like permease